jgi:hypothetical protein
MNKINSIEDLQDAIVLEQEIYRVSYRQTAYGTTRKLFSQVFQNEITKSFLNDFVTDKKFNLYSSKPII